MLYMRQAQHQGELAYPQPVSPSATSETIDPSSIVLIVRQHIQPTSMTERTCHQAVGSICTWAYPDFLYVLCGNGIYSHNVLCEVLHSI